MVDAVRRTKSSIKQLFVPGMFFEDMGITYLGPVVGHNLKELIRAFREAKKVKGPVLLHVLTKKGKGYLPAEEEPSRFHGTEPFDIRSGKPLKKKEKDMDIHVVCEEEHCSCEDGVLKSALKHTFKIFVYILLITFMLTFVIELIGEDQLAVVFQDIPVVGEMIAALVGLIPNCASSVVITELYLSGIIGAGAMMSGLLVNAGVGLLVLFRLNRDWKQNAGIMAALYGFGVVWGVIIELLGIVF